RRGKPHPMMVTKTSMAKRIRAMPNTRELRRRCMASPPHTGVFALHASRDTGVGTWDAGCRLATSCGNTLHRARHALWSLSLPVPYRGSDLGCAEVFALEI